MAEEKKLTFYETISAFKPLTADMEKTIIEFQQQIIYGDFWKIYLLTFGPVTPLRPGRPFSPGIP